MNAVLNMPTRAHMNVFGQTLSLDDVRKQAPAAFAESAHEDLSAKYTFIPTTKVISGLLDAGFAPVEARQARTVRTSSAHALHAVRLRRNYEQIALRDAVPEILLWNSHDGSSAYHLRMMLFRAVCTNGLVVSQGAFPSVCVAHRGNVVEEVVTGALEISGRFDLLARQVERMEQRRMLKDEQLQFAERALAFRFPNPQTCGIEPSRLLTARRSEDLADNLYTVLNRVQEHLVSGGLHRRTATGRLTHTRRMSSIRNGVRLNSQLWDLATEVLAA